MQEFIHNIFKERYQISSAYNGKQALKQLEKGPVDLIVSDVMMPEMDGFALLEHLRNDELHRSTPIIMLTALNDESKLYHALSLGVDEYLTKPFSPKELITRIDNMLSRYEVRRQMAKEMETLPAGEKEAFSHTERNYQKNKDETFMEQVERKILSELENEEFSLKKMSEEFHMSYNYFWRKVKMLTGLSPKQYQKEVALQKARQLLENGTYDNASAVAYSVGIRHVSRFSQLYEKRFGKKPADYFLT